MTRALLWIARWIAQGHDRWRRTAVRRRPLAVEIAVLREEIERLKAENQLLRSRLARTTGCRRARYRAWERLAILWHGARYGLSVHRLARAFALSEQTLLNWRKEVREGVSRLVRARPPVNRLPELVEHVVRLIKREYPAWGTRRMAGILSRLGIAASRSSVQRLLRRRPRRSPSRVERRLGRGPHTARYPGHVWLIDFTRLKGLFRSVTIGAVIDLHSRKVLAVRACRRGPKAAFACRLVRVAMGKFGPPRWMITDQGREFTAGAFGRLLRRNGIRRRFGAVGRWQSVSVIERWWRTLKSEFARGALVYRPITAIDRDLAWYVRWFNEERPHEGLSGLAPDDVYHGRAKKPARRIEEGMLTIRHLAGRRQLPVFRLNAAA